MEKPKCIHFGRECPTGCDECTAHVRETIERLTQRLPKKKRPVVIWESDFYEEIKPGAPFVPKVVK